MKSAQLLLPAVLLVLLQGCATEPVDMVLKPSPDFQPVYPWRFFRRFSNQGCRLYAGNRRI